MRKITPPIRALISNDTVDILEEISAAEHITEIVVNFLTKTTHSVDEIAALVVVPVNFVKEVEKRLKRKNK